MIWNIRGGNDFTADEDLHDSELQMGKSFSSLHHLNADMIGKLFPEPQLPCCSLKAAPDTDKANTQSHAWVRWGGNKAKNPTAGIFPGEASRKAVPRYQRLSLDGGGTLKGGIQLAN